MGMWQGNLPTLGPETSNQQFRIPPLYYYLLFPSSTLGANPVFLALTNAVLSFGSVIIFMYLIYSLLQSVEPDKRLLLTSIAGLWWSVSIVDIQLNNRSWNPSLVPFFLMAFLLLYAVLLQRNRPIVLSLLAWLGYGACAAILVSLHGSTLIVTPIFFFASIAYYIFTRRTTPKIALLPLAAVASFFGCLTPYWSGELARHWANTQSIAAAMHSHMGMGLLPLANNVRNAYFGLRTEMYFPDFTLPSAVRDGASNLALRIMGLLFLTVAPVLGFAVFRGNRVLIGVLAAYWLIYMVAAANLPISYLHYKLPIVLAPIILAIASLAYLNYATVAGRLAALFLGTCLLISILMNVRDDYAYLHAKFGKHRLLTSDDLVTAMNVIPPNATMCGPERQLHLRALEYIDLFIEHKHIRFDHTCRTGNYIVHPRYIFEIAPSLTSAINDDLNVVDYHGIRGSTTVLETDTFVVERR